ncbi:MAG TPA: hypothetical protein VI589_07760, partial [Vicinamibacteria bacterium]
LEEANALFPFVFSRAWTELRQEKVDRVAAAPAAAVVVAAAPVPAERPTITEEDLEAGGLPSEVVYPLDPLLRERVIEIERMMSALERDLDALRARGSVDDILLQTCRKLMARAKESISSREATDYAAKRLDMTRNSLMTTWRQVQSRLR